MTDSPTARWEAILRFCHTAGCKVLWDVNIMYGSCCSRLPASENMGYMTGHCGDTPIMKTAECRPWDSSNARALLEYTHALPRPIADVVYGFELGNENIWARLALDFKVIQTPLSIFHS